MNKIDLGAVSAYALAKEKGYQGTAEEFSTLMMQSGDNALRAEAAANRAEEILGSIPPEYTELSNQVGENTENVAALTEEIVGLKSTERNEIQLYDKTLTDNLLDAYFSASITQSTGVKMLYIPCEPSTDYTVSIGNAMWSRFVIGACSVLPEIGATVNELAYNKVDTVFENRDYVKVTTKSNSFYLVVWYFRNASDVPRTEEEIRNTIMIVKGDLICDYIEPYNTFNGRLEEKHIVENYGLTYGSEIVTTNNWTLGTGWSGDLENGFIHTLGQTAPLTLSTEKLSGIYKVEFTVEALSSQVSSIAGVTVHVGGSEGFDIYEGNFTEHTYVFGIESNGSNNLVFKPITGFDGTIKNISLKKVNGITKGSHKIFDVEDNLIFEFKGNTEDDNIAFGRDNMKNNINGVQNVAVGVQAMMNNTSGFWNTAVGAYALEQNTIGSRNIAIGYIALRKNQTGNRNIAIGTFALHDCLSGIHNIALGADTMQRLTSGANNIGIGINALANITEEEGNVGIGYDALGSVKTSKNVAIGWKAGNDIVTGRENICIGSMADTVSDVSNTIVIGANVTSDQSNEIKIGNTNHNSVIIANKRIIFNEDGTVTWEVA